MHPQKSIFNFIERTYLPNFSDILIAIDNYLETKSYFKKEYYTSTVIDLSKILNNIDYSRIKHNDLIISYIENYYKNQGWSKAEVNFNNGIKIYKKQTPLNKWFYGEHSYYQIPDGLFLHLSY